MARASERPEGASSEGPKVPLTAGGFAAGESTREGARDGICKCRRGEAGEV